MAAGASQTGVVGTFGGINIPPVTIFMDGFVRGVAHYNDVNGTSVTALGWDTEDADGLFTGNFESLDDGRSFAQTLVDNGADIVLPVAGPVGLGSAALCQDTGSCLIIGVDADFNLTASQFSDIILTSVLKNIDVAIFNTINNVLVLDSVGNIFNGTLANGGVGLAPCRTTLTAFLQICRLKLMQSLQVLPPWAVSRRTSTRWCRLTAKRTS